MTVTEAPVLFDEQTTGDGGKLGCARLNAPRTINALGQPMIDALDARLRDWAADPALRCVLLEGAGDRGFCAGGDVVRLRDALPAGIGPDAPLRRFYESEYALDRLIHTYDKPILCWADGLAMGGGLGLMNGASHRVVTERSRLAMPEIRIGFYPDVGATWFLNRLPARAGLFLALTGAPVGAADALSLGLADHRIPSRRYGDVRQALVDASWSGDPADDGDRLSRTLRRFTDAGDEDGESAPLRANWPAIARALERRTADGLVAELLALEPRDDWIADAIGGLRDGSPTSARVIVEQLARGRHLSLDEAFRAELRLSLALAQRPDFAEGVRARLIDKDGAPRWRPGRLDEVAEADVARCFEGQS